MAIGVVNALTSIIVLVSLLTVKNIPGIMKLMYKPVNTNQGLIVCKL